MSVEIFTLADCPTPYAPWMAGMTLPEISITIPLEDDEDLTGATVVMILIRDTSDPDNPDILEKNLVEVENIIGQHAIFKVDWVVADLIEGQQQEATFRLDQVGGDQQFVGRFNIDVVANPDPTP